MIRSSITEHLALLPHFQLPQNNVSIGDGILHLIIIDINIQTLTINDGDVVCSLGQNRFHHLDHPIYELFSCQTSSIPSSSQTQKPLFLSKWVRWYVLSKEANRPYHDSPSPSFLVSDRPSAGSSDVCGSRTNVQTSGGRSTTPSTGHPEFGRQRCIVACDWQGVRGVDSVGNNP